MSIADRRSGKCRKQDKSRCCCHVIDPAVFSAQRPLTDLRKTIAFRLISR